MHAVSPLTVGIRAIAPCTRPHTAAVSTNLIRHARTHVPRLELSKRNAAAAEWEAAAADLPRLAVAAQVAGGGGGGGGAHHLLRRALLDLPPFPLEELTQGSSHERISSGRQGTSPASGGAGAPDYAQEPSGDVPWPGGPEDGQAAVAGGGSAEMWRAYVVLSFLSNVRALAAFCNVVTYAVGPGWSCTRALCTGTRHHCLPHLRVGWAW